MTRSRLTAQTIAALSAITLTACDTPLGTRAFGGDIVGQAVEIAAAREPYVIDGTCMSACTMQLHRGCITDRARLMFHPPIGTTPDNHALAVAYIGARYPDDLRQWWLDDGHKKRTWMTADELARLGAQRCGVQR